MGRRAEDGTGDGPTEGGREGMPSVRGTADKGAGRDGGWRWLAKANGQRLAGAGRQESKRCEQERRVVGKNSKVAGKKVTMVQKAGMRVKAKAGRHHGQQGTAVRVGRKRVTVERRGG